MSRPNERQLNISPPRYLDEWSIVRSTNPDGALGVQPGGRLSNGRRVVPNISAAASRRRNDVAAGRPAPGALKVQKTTAAVIRVALELTAPPARPPHCDLTSEMRLCFAYPPKAKVTPPAAPNPTAMREAGGDRVHHYSCTSDGPHDAQISGRDSMCCRCQRGLQSLDIRTQIRLPAAGTTAIGAMLIGNFLVDGSESGRGETHHRHGRQLGCTKNIAEGCHDGPMHLCAGRFAVRIWLHDCSRPLSLLAP